MSELQLCSYQFSIIHRSIDDFKIGEKVFLKSGSPDFLVIGFRKNKVLCTWFYRKNGIVKRRKSLFVPEVILQRNLESFQYCIN